MSLTTKNTWSSYRLSNPNDEPSSMLHSAPGDFFVPTPLNYADRQFFKDKFKTAYVHAFINPAHDTVEWAWTFKAQPRTEDDWYKCETSPRWSEARTIVETAMRLTQ